MQNKENTPLFCAIDEIKSVMKSTKSQARDEKILKIVEKADQYLSDLRETLRKSAISPEKISSILDDQMELEQLGYEVFDEAELETLATKEAHYIEVIFPEMPKIKFEYILSSQSGKATSRILPYLLSSFYLNFYGGHGKKRIRQSIADEFKSLEMGDKRLHDGSYYRDVNDLCELFSYEDFLPALFEYGRKDKKNSIDRIVDSKSYMIYLRKYAGGDASVKNSKLYYSQIYKACLYCTISTACSDVLGDTNSVDYEESWNLFDKHTLSLTAAFVDVGFQENFIYYYNFISKNKQFRDISKIAHSFDDTNNTFCLLQKQKAYTHYANFFKQVLDPSTYPPFSFPTTIAKNLLNKGHLAYMVIHTRKA